MFEFLKPYEIWFENAKDYAFECAWQFGTGIVKWYQHGGFHRLLVFVALIMTMITLKWLWERLQAWLDKFGEGGKND